MKLAYKLVVTVLFSLFCITAYADNWTFLDGSAITYFTNKDKDLMEGNVLSALNRLPDGKKSTWKNPATGAWGYAIPSKTAIKNGNRCRTVTVFNSARQTTGQAVYRLCKINNQWEIVGN